MELLDGSEFTGHNTNGYWHVATHTPTTQEYSTILCRNRKPNRNASSVRMIKAILLARNGRSAEATILPAKQCFAWTILFARARWLFRIDVWTDNAEALFFAKAKSSCQKSANVRGATMVWYRTPGSVGGGGCGCGGWRAGGPAGRVPRSVNNCTLRTREPLGVNLSGNPGCCVDIERVEHPTVVARVTSHRREALSLKSSSARNDQQSIWVLNDSCPVTILSHDHTMK
jgi:hypothetical protein